MPYDFSTTYQGGTRMGPRAILEASRNMELWDEELGPVYRAGIHTLPELAEVKSTVVRVTKPDGWAVLNADDGHVYRMGRHCAGRVVLFSMSTEKGEDGFDRVDGHLGRGVAQLGSAHRSGR